LDEYGGFSDHLQVRITKSGHQLNGPPGSLIRLGLELLEVYSEYNPEEFMKSVDGRKGSRSSRYHGGITFVRKESCRQGRSERHFVLDFTPESNLGENIEIFVVSTRQLKNIMNKHRELEENTPRVQDRKSIHYGEIMPERWMVSGNESSEYRRYKKICGEYLEMVGNSTVLICPKIPRRNMILRGVRILGWEVDPEEFGGISIPSETETLGLLGEGLPEPPSRGRKVSPKRGRESDPEGYEEYLYPIQ
jgi:hypothetical protein